MHTVVFASGEVPPESPELRRRLDEADFVIAADGGLRHSARLGIRADLLVGDLDSAPPDLVTVAAHAGTEVVDFPEEKDETDLELALTIAVERGATSVNVLGLFGGRVDHEIANLALIAAPRWSAAGCRLWADDGHRSVWVVHDELRLRLPPGTTLSLVPWGADALGVHSSGVRWPLDGATLPAGTPRGVSNVAVGSVQYVSVDDGLLLVVVDRSEAQPPLSGGR